MSNLQTGRLPPLALDCGSTVEITPSSCHRKIQEEHNLSAVELQQLIEWAGPIPMRVDTCIHDLFAQQVLLRPDAQAIKPGMVPGAMPPWMPYLYA